VRRDHPDYAAIEWLHAEVIDLGDAKGRFHPTKSLKRDEAVAVFAAYDQTVEAPSDARRLPIAEALWRLAGSPAPQAAHPYRDVPTGSPAADAVAWVVDAGIVEADSSSKFGANARIDRAELARWLFRVDAVREANRAAVVADFDSGAQGWAIASWETNGGTATAIDGRLVVDAGPGGNWVSWAGGLDLSERTQLLLDVPVTSGFDTKAALQLGPDWTWCETGQSGWVDVPSTGPDAVAIDLTTLSADCRALLGDVRGVNLFLNEGHHEIDAVGVR
jgi:mannan endo-1,4-beta-mannosidase